MKPFLLGVFILCTALHAAIPYQVQAQSTDTFTVRALYGDDAIAPSTPASITVTPIAQTQIDVVWSAATDNVAVAGYKLYRDSVQIATTTLLLYSDTGRAASTTYAYFVRAFDIFGNVSSSSVTVSTTTFAIPPTLPLTATSTNGASTILPPSLVDFSIDPGAESARFTFSTRQPVTFTLRFGTTSGLHDGFVQSDVFKKDQTTIITDLISATEYFYELYGTDRFGRERLLKRGSFTTARQFVVNASPNVSFFSAAVSDQNVLLRWGNPTGDAFAYVRVVRNHYYYPLSPTDGFVIYEGMNESFFDAGVLSAKERQYYTIFTYNIDGQPSSGAVTMAVRGGKQIAPNPQPTLPNLPGATTSEEDVFNPEASFDVTFEKIVVIQNGSVVVAVDGVLTLQTNEPFLIQMPKALVPKTARTVIVTWQHPTILEQKTSYLLRLNAEQTAYEAMAAPMSDGGLYPLQLAAFDAATNELGVVIGVLRLVPADTISVEKESVLYVATTYLIIGGVIGLLTVLGLWWLLMLLIRVLFGTRKN